MKYSIITIGREHGSGGRTIAQMVADKLQIPLYDRKLIQMIAEDSGFAASYVETSEMRRTSSFLYNLYFDSRNLPLDDQVFLAQANVITKLAEKGPCVIVGRCADYILRDKPSVLKVFVYAPMEERVRRVEEDYGEKASDYQRYLQKIDRHRSAYYDRFTGEEWGNPHNYHLLINSAIVLPAAAQQIITLAGGKEKE